MSKEKPIILWFRQDLRLSDHPALSYAVATGKPIVFLYIHDEETAGMRPLGAASKWWLQQSLNALHKNLAELGGGLLCLKGAALAVLEDVMRKTGADEVVWHRLYEPYATARDTEIKASLKDKVKVQSFNGALLHEPWDVANKEKKPYRVYTPFSKACFEKNMRDLLPAPQKINAFTHNLKSHDLSLLPKINWYQDMTNYWQVGEAAAQKRLKNFCDKLSVFDYKAKRDFPGDDEGVSHLSPHLHFGEISPQQVWHHISHLAAQKNKDATPFLRQLLWREFSAHLLYHFPRMVDRPLDEKFVKFPWQGDQSLLASWQKGQTGIPIVDAGMRQLWKTGWMHNRVRMIVASFLVKNMLLPWQEGEAWFWDTLVDADLANNVASWQWVAGCGADAAPYFRIFNPILQSKKFDGAGDYIRRFVPELKNMPSKFIHAPHEAPALILQGAGVKLGHDYPYPIVDLQKTRLRALEAYGVMKEAI
jgi:deoxyribodipyrimidine photo-lyase